MELEGYVAYATCVARCLWRDPEAESLANIVAWRAYKTYNDPAIRYGNWTEEGWIAHLVKKRIYDEWRRRGAIKRNLESTDGWWEQVVSCVDDEYTEDLIPQEDWQLLCEKYIDRWAWDVVAKRHGWSMAEARRRVDDAVRRFQNAIG